MCILINNYPDVVLESAAIITPSLNSAAKIVVLIKKKIYDYY